MAMTPAISVDAPGKFSSPPSSTTTCLVSPYHPGTAHEKRSFPYMDLLQPWKMLGEGWSDELHHNFVAGDASEFPNIDGQFCIKSIWGVIWNCHACNTRGKLVHGSCLCLCFQLWVLVGDFLGTGFLVHGIVFSSLQLTSGSPASTPLNRGFVTYNFRVSALDMSMAMIWKQEEVKLIESVKCQKPQ